jgi:hypothetical protein
MWELDMEGSQDEASPGDKCKNLFKTIKPKTRAGGWGSSNGKAPS